MKFKIQMIQESENGKTFRTTHNVDEVAYNSIGELLDKIDKQIQ